MTKQKQAKKNTKQNEEQTLYDTYCYSLVIRNKDELEKLSKANSQKYFELVALVQKKMRLYNSGLILVQSCQEEYQDDLLAGLLPLDAEILDIIERMNDIAKKTA